MKRIGDLWPKVIAFDNLLLAWRKARRGKRRSASVAAFGLGLERELFALQAELEEGHWRPGPYRLFTVYERKPRLIAAAPFRDRVVHHALMNVIEPPLDRRFIYDCYACRQNKGVHAAVDRYQGWARRHVYVLKMDIEKYFPSIDRQRLLDKLGARIKDQRVMALLNTVIDGAPTGEAPLHWYPGDDLLTPLERPRGIPIGNLTSQFFANLYLDDFDHWMKEVQRVGTYLRYVDDMVALDDDKARLAELRAAVREKLAGDRLRLHPDKAHISPARDGLNLLGYVVFPEFRRLRADNVRRFGHRLRNFARAYGDGRMYWQDIDPCVQSWIGHARHADTEGLRTHIFSSVAFCRETGRRTPSA